MKRLLFIIAILLISNAKAQTVNLDFLIQLRNTEHKSSYEILKGLRWVFGDVHQRENEYDYDYVTMKQGVGAKDEFTYYTSAYSDTYSDYIVYRISNDEDYNELVVPVLSKAKLMESKTKGLSVNEVYESNGTTLLVNKVNTSNGFKYLVTIYDSGYYLKKVKSK